LERGGEGWRGDLAGLLFSPAPSYILKDVGILNEASPKSARHSSILLLHIVKEQYILKDVGMLNEASPKFAPSSIHVM
jgi:hypothetical protein